MVVAVFLTFEQGGIKWYLNDKWIKKVPFKPNSVIWQRILNNIVNFYILLLNINMKIVQVFLSWTNSNPLKYKPTRSNKFKKLK